MLSLDSIQSIFTLRYDIFREPFYQDKIISDFSPINLDWVYDIKSRLCSIIDEKLFKYDKIAISLSGGLDSTLALGLIRKQFPNKKITAIIDRSSGETDKAVNMAMRFDSKYFVITHRPIHESIPRYVKITREPRWNVYHSDVMKKAKELECDVLVTGDMADELFGGYTFRYRQFLDGGNYMDCHRNDWVKDNVFCEPMGYELAIKIFKMLEISNIHEVLLADYNGKLNRDLLTTSDALSSFYQIPTFSPYSGLRYDATHIPLGQKIKIKKDGIDGKLILKEISDSIGLHHDNTKKGYTPAPNELIDGKFYVLDKILNENKYNSQLWSIIDKKFVTKNIDSWDYGYLNKLYQIYALAEYLKLNP